jgi:hypothetical protein
MPNWGWQPGKTGNQLATAIKREAHMADTNVTGTENNGAEPEKKFTQADIDHIVGERVAREREKYTGYDDLKDLPAILKDFGYEGTPAEIKAAVKVQADAYRAQKEIESLQTQAKATGTSPELLADIKTLKTQLAALEKQKVEQDKVEAAKQKAVESANQQIAEFGVKYPTMDVEKLLADPKFSRFVSRANPSLTLTDVYEDYLDLIGGAESSAAEKIKSNLERSTSSGREKGDASTGTYGLTSRQQDLAKENGMSNKQYADLLANIKK